MEKKISTSEVLGELRRMSRQYKVFEKAVEAAETLLDHEKEVSKLKAEAKSLEEIKSDLDIECNDYLLQIEGLKETIKQSNLKIEKDLAASKVKINEMEQNAKSEAELIVNNAKQKVADTIARARQARNEEATAIEAKDKALSDLEAVKKEIRETRERFAKSLS